MKFTIVVFLSIFSIAELMSQDSTSVAQTEVMAVEEPVKGPVLSANPSASELADLFMSGEVNSDEAIRRAVEKGDAAVEGLVELLMSSNDRWRKSDDPMAAMPNKLLVVDALIGVRSAEGYLALTQSSMTDPDMAVRARALNALVSKYHEVSTTGIVAPQKEVVQAFIGNLGDETFIGSVQRTLSQISQEGIMKWLGVDFGDPMFEEERLAVGGGAQDVGAARYAAVWWQGNSQKLRWNQETLHFEVTSE